MPVLKMIQVSYEDNDQKIVKNASHFFEKSSVTVFLGKPGSGKSTALKLLAGLIPPSSGTITFEDKDIHAMNRKQDPRLQKKSSVYVSGFGALGKSGYLS